MKRCVVVICGVLLCSFPAVAEEVTEAMKERIAQPITMNKTKDVKRHVIFNHNTHENFECAVCHHEPVAESIYVSCASEGCHDNMDKKDKSIHGYYQTIHKKGVEKSCVGCHASAVADNPALKAQLTGCKTCHKKQS